MCSASRTSSCVATVADLVHDVARLLLLLLLSPPARSLYILSTTAGKKGQRSLMEELYEDLGQLRRRLEEVQAGIDDKSDMYTTLFHR